jgi:ATP-dependent Clp protease protease subunit
VAKKPSRKLKENVGLVTKSAKSEMFGKMNRDIFGDDEVNQAVMVLGTEVTAEVCSELIAEIITINFMDEDERPDIINLLITSPGGDMDAAIGLINTMGGSSVPIRTIALGRAASAALCILMAGDHRVVTPWTNLMSHQFSSAMEGTYTDLKTAADEFNKYYKKMVDIYATFTKQPKKKIEADLLNHTDVFLTPDEAKEYGIVDMICGLD